MNLNPVITSLDDMPVEVDPMRRGGHKAKIDRRGHVGILVNTSVMELNFKHPGVFIVTDRAQMAGFNRCSIHSNHLLSGRV